MNNNYNINIEKSILASILFNNDIFNDIKHIFSVTDFYHIHHQKIYSAMLHLNKADYPIEETFILKADKEIDENILIEIMSVNAISNPVAYAREIRKDSIKRNIQLLSIKLQEDFDPKIIEQLQIENEKLGGIDEVRKIKVLDTKSESFFDSIDLDPAVAENTTFEYLYDNFIVKREITMIAARSGIGKSLTTFALVNHFMQNSKIKTCYYLANSKNNRNFFRYKIGV